uniref:CSON012053 protein n=1 Tax=Culicoides sonorensis TaxID=179676 RepID=A0A336M4I1_CULSO
MSLSDISIKFNEKTLNEIIAKYSGTKCTGWRFVGGFKKGDSYLSQVFRLQIDGQRGKDTIQINTIIKSIPKNVGRRKTFRSADFFRNEIHFYERTMKACLQHQDKMTLNDMAVRDKVFNGVPRCISSFSDGENDFIVLEDLGGEGYSTVSRHTGMDLNHCIMAMQILGRFHAVSLAYRFQKPQEFEASVLPFVEETYNDDKFYDWYKKLQGDLIATALDAVEKEYAGTEIEAKAKSFLTNNLFKKIVQCTHETNKYSVLCQGDCWTPNFLFKYRDDGSIPIGVKMIDFQLARFASPATDISFFIYSCTTQDLREKHYDDLLKSYHMSLADQLKVYGLNVGDVFPYQALLEELKERACFGIGMGIESIPFSVMEDDEAGDLDKIEGEEAVDVTTVWIIRPIKNKEGRLRLAEIFKHAVQMGYI